LPNPFQKRPDRSYWELFINKEPDDPDNVVRNQVRFALGGKVFGAKADVHDPLALTMQIRQFATFLGADLFGVVKVTPELLGECSVPDIAGPATYKFALVSVVRSPFDLRASKGIGGQLALERLAVINFNVASYIRELGFKAVVGLTESLALAVAAGLGLIDKRGRFSARGIKGHVAIADVVLTEIPLAPDSPALPESRSGSL
jgi:hypothetical protein